MNFNFTTKLTALLLMSGIFLTSACSFSAKTAIEIALEGVVDGSAALLSTAASISNPSADVTLAVAYARSASVAASASLTEYNSTDPTAIKIAVCTGYWSQVVVPVLGQTNASLLAVGVTAIATAVSEFLTQLHAAQPAFAAAHGIDLGKLKPSTLVLNARLKKLKSKADANVTAADHLLTTLAK